MTELKEGDVVTYGNIRITARIDIHGSKFIAVLSEDFLSIYPRTSNTIDIVNDEREPKK